MFFYLNTCSIVANILIINTQQLLLHHHNYIYPFRLGAQAELLTIHKNPDAFIQKECEAEEMIRSLEVGSFYDSKRVQECMERLRGTGYPVFTGGKPAAVEDVEEVIGGKGESLGQIQVEPAHGEVEEQPGQGDSGEEPGEEPTDGVGQEANTNEDGDGEDGRQRGNGRNRGRGRGRGRRRGRGGRGNGRNGGRGRLNNRRRRGDPRNPGRVGIGGRGRNRPRGNGNGRTSP